MLRRRSAMSILGWLLMESATAMAQVDDDCRACHVGASRPEGAPDLSAYYDQRRAHHPAAVTFPAGATSSAYGRPTGQSGEIVFFDADGDGAADDDEVRLYGSLTSTVECASCHRPHGGQDDETPPNPAWLRVANDASQLCLVCHRR